MVSGEPVTLNSTTARCKMAKCQPQEIARGSSMYEPKGREGGGESADKRLGSLLSTVDIGARSFSVGQFWALWDDKRYP